MQIPKVLIIDDEPILRQTLKKALKHEGYALFFAENGRQGLDSFHQTVPDLIFLDLKMPVMDGFDFLQAVNYQPVDPYTVVVITGHGGDEDIQKCYRMGVHSFLKKPLNLVEICSLADRCIKFKALEKERENLIVELKSALSTIKTLEGFLPICASCKKIRDEENQWHEIDVYIRQHTDAEFSHSVCPSCIKRLYPELHDHMAKKAR